LPRVAACLSGEDRTATHKRGREECRRNGDDCADYPFYKLMDTFVQEPGWNPLHACKLTRSSRVANDLLSLIWPVAFGLQNRRDLAERKKSLLGPPDLGVAQVRQIPLRGEFSSKCGRWRPSLTIGWISPCVDGSPLARVFFEALQSWSVRPCVRPVGAAQEGRWP
jgi:hypothetical protein